MAQAECCAHAEDFSRLFGLHTEVTWFWLKLNARFNAISNDSIMTIAIAFSLLYLMLSYVAPKMVRKLRFRSRPDIAIAVLVNSCGISDIGKKHIDNWCLVAKLLGVPAGKLRADDQFLGELNNLWCFPGVDLNEQLWDWLDEQYPNFRRSFSGRDVGSLLRAIDAKGVPGAGQIL